MRFYHMYSNLTLGPKIVCGMNHKKEVKVLFPMIQGQVRFTFITNKIKDICSIIGVQNQCKWGPTSKDIAKDCTRADWSAFVAGEAQWAPSLICDHFLFIPICVYEIEKYPTTQRLLLKQPRKYGRSQRGRAKPAGSIHCIPRNNDAGLALDE